MRNEMGSLASWWPSVTGSAPALRHKMSEPTRHATTLSFGFIYFWTGASLITGVSEDYPPANKICGLFSNLTSCNILLLVAGVTETSTKRR